MKRTTSKKSAGSDANKEEIGLPKLAQPAQRALAAAGVQRLEQLTKFSEEEVKHWHGMGPNALKQLRRALDNRGLSFADDSSK